jgi:hypothetical protein
MMLGMCTRRGADGVPECAVAGAGQENGAVARLNHPEGLLRALRHHNAFRHAHLAVRCLRSLGRSERAPRPLFPLAHGAVLSHTQVVRPTHYADGCFACYTNFVPKLTR